MDIQIKCPICRNLGTKKMFNAVVRDKYQAEYRFCDQCRFLFVGAPSWLSEAYKEPINISDTGIMARNIAFSKMTSAIIYFLFKRKGEFLDYAGGYGIFVRLMRDIGFDFYWYDPYSTNLMARGFELVDGMSNFELLTCFETLEHFVDPLKEVEKMFQFSDSILFSTSLLPIEIPEPTDWFYYGLNHGQHISFYSFTTIQFMAKHFACNLYSDGATIHMFTKRSFSPLLFRSLLRVSRYGLFFYVCKNRESKTMEDSLRMS